MKMKRTVCLLFPLIALLACMHLEGANVRDFGAKGDGVSDDTDALQAAIDAGGEVYLPPGIYATGTLYLKSNGGLRLDDGATLRAIPKPERYNKPDFCPQNGTGENKLAAHLIVALHCTNIFIRGGTIDGNSPVFHKGMPVHHRSMRGRPTKKWPKWMPSQMLFLCESKNVTVQDTCLVNATFWSCFFYGCENVLARRVRVWTDPQIAGDDGLDVDACHNVLIEDCDIDVGDDAIAIRGSPGRLTDKMRACQNVRVRNCRVRSEYAHGVRVGVGGGIIRDVHISNLVMERTRGAIHINPRYSDSGRGVDISDVTFENIKATCDNFIFVSADYFFVKTNKFTRSLGDLHFKGLSGTCRLPLTFLGNGIANVHDITVEKSHFTFLPAHDMPSGDWRFFLLDNPHGTVVTNHVRNVTFRDVTFEDRRTSAHVGALGYTATAGALAVPVIAVSPRKAYAAFDTAGKTTLTLTLPCPADACDIRLPPSARLLARGQNTLTLGIDAPCTGSIVPRAPDMPGLVFAAQACETDIPDRDKPEVIYLGAGLHRKDITLGNGQTLYLAAGAVMEGALCVEGTNATVRGRGRFDGAKRDFPASRQIVVKPHANVTVRDIAIFHAGDLSWRSQKGVTLENVIFPEL